MVYRKAFVKCHSYTGGVTQGMSNSLVWIIRGCLRNQTYFFGLIESLLKPHYVWGIAWAVHLHYEQDRYYLCLVRIVPQETDILVFIAGKRRQTKGWKWKVTRKACPYAEVLTVKKAGWEPRHLGHTMGWPESGEEQRPTAWRSQCSR